MHVATMKARTSVLNENRIYPIQCYRCHGPLLSRAAPLCSTCAASGGQDSTQITAPSGQGTGTSAQGIGIPVSGMGINVPYPGTSAQVARNYTPRQLAPIPIAPVMCPQSAATAFRMSYPPNFNPFTPVGVQPSSSGQGFNCNQGRSNYFNRYGNNIINPYGSCGNNGNISAYRTYGHGSPFQTNSSSIGNPSCSQLTKSQCNIGLGNRQNAYHSFYRGQIRGNRMSFNFRNPVCKLP